MRIFESSVTQKLPFWVALLWFCVLWSRVGLFQDTEFFADLGEGCDASVEMLLLVAGGYLNADTGLVFRHYRVVESGYEDAFVLQAGGHLLRQRS